MKLLSSLPTVAICLLLSSCVTDSDFLILPPSQGKITANEMAVTLDLAEQLQFSSDPSDPRYGYEGYALLAKVMKRGLFDPTLDRLRRAFSHDKELTELLDRVELISLSGPADGRPNAMATIFNDKEFIGLDMFYLSDLLYYSDLGSLLMANHPDLYQYAFLAGELYREQAIENESFLLVPDINEIIDAIDPPKLRALVVTLRTEISQSAVTWALLHEVGHHYLGHLGIRIAEQKNGIEVLDYDGALSISRNNELEADRWAIEKMRDMGYGLNALESFFAARELADNVLSNLGFGTLESQAGHPSWSTRIAQLRAIADTNSHGTIPVVWLSAFTPTEEDLGAMTDIIIMLDDETGQGLSSAKSAPIAPWSDKESGLGIPLYPMSLQNGYGLYYRDSTGLVEINVRDLDSERPRVALRVRQFETGFEVEYETVAIRRNAAALFTESDIEILNPSIQFQLVCEESGVVGDTYDAARKSFKAWQNSRMDMFVQYSKGEKYSGPDDIQIALQRLDREFRDNMADLLGGELSNEVVEKTILNLENNLTDWYLRTPFVDHHLHLKLKYWESQNMRVY